MIRWVRGDETRSAGYDEALRDYAHKVALECLPIADAAFVDIDGEAVPTDVQRDRLRIDTRMKLAGKWDKIRYGTSVTVEQLPTAVDDGALLLGMVELLRLAGSRPLVIEAVVNDI